MATEDRYLNWKTAAQVVAGLLLAVLTAVNGLILRQSVANGQDIATLKAEMAARNARTDREHAEFVRRAELEADLRALGVDINRMNETIRQLQDEVRAMRRDRQ